MPKKLIMLIDAMGQQFFSRKDVERLGSKKIYFSKTKPPLAFSFGILSSFFTGKAPDQLGLWTEFYVDLQGRTPFRKFLYLVHYIPDFLIKFKVINYMINGILFIINRFVFNEETFYPLNIPAKILPYFQRAKLQFYNDYISGNQTIFGIMKGRKIKYRYTGWPVDNENLDTMLGKIEQILRDDSSEQIIFSYLPHMDHDMHVLGTDSKSIISIKDKIIQFLENITNRSPGLTFLVFSDHGMINMKTLINITEILNKNGLKRGIDYIDFIDSTMHRFWTSKKIESRIKEILMKEKLPGHILANNELKKAGVFFKPPQFGNVIFLANPGITFSNSYFSVTGHVSKALHGYDPNHPSQQGVLLSNIELFNEGKTYGHVEMHIILEKFIEFQGKTS